MSKTSHIRINVGCGDRPTPGWENLDNSWSLRLARSPVTTALLRLVGVVGARQIRYMEFARQNRMHWADITRRLPYADASVDVVYSCHVMEHLDREEVRRYLREVFRVLKSGGVVRSALPNVATIVDDYIQTGDADRLVGRLMFETEKPRRFGDRVRTVFVGHRKHLWMYDPCSLAGLHTEVGFANAVSLPPGQTRISDPGALDLSERADESVYVEAVRP